jgi:hypothetical protein
MKKNRNIWLTTLRKLPVYNPEDKIWVNITTKLEIKGVLTQIEKPEQIEMFNNLNEPVNYELNVKNNPVQLISYDPPEEVWNCIEEKLESREYRRSNKLIKVWISWSISAAAAIIAGLLVVNGMFQNKHHVNFSEVWQKTTDVSQWDNDQVIDKTIALLCSENPSSCEKPEFRKLEKELESLNLSKKAILDQLNQFDENRDLEITLTKIELSQTDIIHQMIALTN